MAVARRCISISFELDQVLDALVAGTGQPKSRLIEILLRENPVIKREVDSLRLELKVKTSPLAVPGKRPGLGAFRAKPVERA